MNILFTLLLAVASFLLPVFASAQVPAYSVEYMGPGYGTMNNSGVVIGNESALYPGTPWVNDGLGFQYLPLPATAVAGSVADINDAGVIVGAIDTNGDAINDVPVKWTPVGLGVYVVETLPLAGNAVRGHAVAINNNGVILASGFAVDALPTYTAYVIDGVAVTHVGLSSPLDINDNGIILTNNQLYDYNSATPIAFDSLPDGMPQGYLYPASINNNNEVIVNILTTIIGFTRYHAIGIYTIDEGWDLLMDVQTMYTAGSINDNGDVTLHSVNPGCGLVYLTGLGYFCPASLLDDGSIDWAVSDASVIANDHTILARGGNSITLQYGLVRLSVAGDLSVPGAPINLAATPHDPTLQQPFNTIDLSWDAADTLSKSYVLERNGPTDTDFVAIATLTNDFYRDVDIVGGETYEYRVIAVGLAGNSLPSTIVSAVAPMPADDTAPVITSISLQNGEVVSGDISIAVTATDDVAIWYIKMNASGLSCTAYSAEATCKWDTSNLAAGDYTVVITAADTMGNYVQETVTVTVEDTPSGSGKDKPNKGNGGSGNGKGRGNK
jgi:putative lipoic acid-binding regulatory protein